MKVLTLHQPFASLWAAGQKKIETRSWHTWHSGPLAVHAGQSEDFRFLARSPGRFRSALERAELDPDDLPFGAIVGIVNLQACVEIQGPATLAFLDLDRDEEAFGDYSLGRYAWIADSWRMLKEPIPARGYQGLWNWTPAEELVDA